jgi:Mg2+ and Co2+ transporter CorA
MSLGRIKNLTMLFVPLSTIAAIFSMGDEFLPGKGKGWIFWVISLPVLFLMFVYTRKSRPLMKQLWTARRGILRKNRREDRNMP